MQSPYVTLPFRLTGHPTVAWDSLGKNLASPQMLWGFHPSSRSDHECSQHWTMLWRCHSSLRTCASHNWILDFRYTCGFPWRARSSKLHTWHQLSPEQESSGLAARHWSTKLRKSQACLSGCQLSSPTATFPANEHAHFLYLLSFCQNACHFLRRHLLTDVSEAYLVKTTCPCLPQLLRTDAKINCEALSIDNFALSKTAAFYNSHILPWLQRSICWPLNPQSRTWDPPLPVQT